MTCKNKCLRFIVPHGHSNFLSSKRCTPCERWFDPSRVTCPCCGAILRSKPRNKTRPQRDVFQHEIKKEAWLVVS